MTYAIEYRTPAGGVAYVEERELHAASWTAWIDVITGYEGTPCPSGGEGVLVPDMEAPDPGPCAPAHMAGNVTRYLGGDALETGLLRDDATGSLAQFTPAASLTRMADTLPMFTANRIPPDQVGLLTPAAVFQSPAVRDKFSLQEDNWADGAGMIEALAEELRLDPAELRPIEVNSDGVTVRSIIDVRTEIPVFVSWRVDGVPPRTMRAHLFRRGSSARSISMR